MPIGVSRGVERILVVDDQQLVLFVMARALEKLDLDCEVLGVSTGQEALDAVEDHTIDLVITDVRMPDMDGVELTERLRTGGCEAVVVWITAYGCQELRAEAERLRVFRCVEKPLEVNLIRRVAREALQSV